MAPASNEHDQQNDPIGIVGLEANVSPEDVKLWLELTGFYDLECREKVLSDGRKLRKLEKSRQKTLAALQTTIGATFTSFIAPPADSTSTPVEDAGHGPVTDADSAPVRCKRGKRRRDKDEATEKPSKTPRVDSVGDSAIREPPLHLKAEPTSSSGAEEIIQPFTNSSANSYQEMPHASANPTHPTEQLGNTGHVVPQNSVSRPASQEHGISSRDGPLLAEPHVFSNARFFVVDGRSQRCCDLSERAVCNSAVFLKLASFRYDSSAICKRAVPGDINMLTECRVNGWSGSR